MVVNQRLFGIFYQCFLEDISNESLSSRRASGGSLPAAHLTLHQRLLSSATRQPSIPDTGTYKVIHCYYSLLLYIVQPYHLSKTRQENRVIKYPFFYIITIYNHHLLKQSISWRLYQMLCWYIPIIEWWCQNFPSVQQSHFTPPLKSSRNLCQCCFFLVKWAVPLLCGLIYLHARYISITSPDISPLLCLTMYYTSFISLYWPYLQLLAFFAASGGRSKLVLASIKPLDRSLFQQHKTFL